MIDETVISSIVDAVMQEIERKHQQIRRYDGVVITNVTLTQLSDIALGRDASPESCAVVYALLEGLNVCLLESALPHRRYADKHGSMMYQVLERNVQLVMSYGVKLLADKDIRERNTETVRPPKYQAPPVAVPSGHANVNCEKVITESMASAMIKGGELAAGGEKVEFPAGTIITPSAKDVFKSNGIDVSVRRK